MNTRLTKAEEDAIITALAQVLAGELEGMTDTKEEDRVRASLESAQRKLWARKSRRSTRGRSRA